MTEFALFARSSTLCVLTCYYMVCGLDKSMLLLECELIFVVETLDFFFLSGIALETTERLNGE